MKKLTSYGLTLGARQSAVSGVNNRRGRVVLVRDAGADEGLGAADVVRCRCLQR